MTKYIWQKATWPSFKWDSAVLINALAEARKHQGLVLGQAKFLQLKDQAEILVEETLATSAIEGEKLDREGVRSSVARRLGLPTAGLPEPKRNADGVVEILLDATTNHKNQLAAERLYAWQAALFPTGYSGLNRITTGAWRMGEGPMQVISGKGGKTVIHYEAPASNVLPQEMKQFIEWWNSPPADLDGVLRAAIAHLWFVTIHPFDDGNGRVARALTDMALAQDEKTSMRLYSLSSQIVDEKKNYYNILETTQKGAGDITEWLLWFLQMFSRGIQRSNALIEKAVLVGDFYKSLGDKNLHERQKKALRKMIEVLPEEFVGGMTTAKYVSITRVSPETAKRDIKDLVDKGILLANESKGRSTSYRLNREITAD